MKVYVEIDKRDAVKAGLDRFGDYVVRVRPGQLTGDERTELAHYGGSDTWQQRDTGADFFARGRLGQYGHGPRVGYTWTEPTVKAVKAWLAKSMEIRSRETERLREVERRYLCSRRIVARAALLFVTINLLGAGASYIATGSALPWWL